MRDKEVEKKEKEEEKTKTRLAATNRFSPKSNPPLPHFTPFAPFQSQSAATRASNTSKRYHRDQKTTQKNRARGRTARRQCGFFSSFVCSNEIERLSLTNQPFFVFLPFSNRSLARHTHTHTHTPAHTKPTSGAVLLLLSSRIVGALRGRRALQAAAIGRSRRTCAAAASTSAAVAPAAATSCGLGARPRWGRGPDWTHGWSGELGTSCGGAREQGPRRQGRRDPCRRRGKEVEHS